MSNTAKYDNSDEVAWLENLSKGNPLALRYIYERYAGKIIAFTEKLLSNREDAEDICHTIFIHLWEQRAQARAIKSIDSYLFRMARNAVIDFHREKVREKTYRQQAQETDKETEQDTAEFENDSRLLKAIDELPEPQRTIIRLSRFEGRSYQEIAGSLNISPHTVHYHVSQALIKLRNTLTAIATLITFHL